VKDDDLYKLLERAVNASGSSRVRAALKGLVSDAAEGAVLTIIANAGVHRVPESFLRGEVYEASRGDWEVSTEKALLVELNEILTRLVSKLRSRHWSRVYLIPTGHPILSIQIKAMVYRVLRINTVDLYYKNGSYFEVDLDQRSVALRQEEHQ
jgi:hypothetical protein